ncbi:MAG TPA: dTMP kinase [Alteromonas australica]|uniref:Thymidylate kinase n=1 Tax=Alteromonas australica TaxID=589873 RepID=A0A353JNS9_9ALTE|nr:dTMP kinase [Alteromonas australica]MAF71055.1 dTMP kinase [Alteromonas sp.]AJP44247.1 thymidylate kinase [Alteromonas australica]MAO30836.1 dTMP kinase [Alteromonas sp.]MBU33367.1 dTMP kinase [Alteromonas sp.]HAI73044.1 dTMP kinase [Alteromonas australica]|tara:strand:- start:5836 stop:6456 length:621 start_codon:yes stop_codon:yes gene_type:complete
MKHGKFIVVEGLEGAGKSSVIGLVKNTLIDAGISVELTREPGGTPMAEAIRECVKHDWEESVAEETELLLMYAARVQLLKNRILPALERGCWVVGDRHDLSSQAYQGGGRGVDASTMQAISEIALGGFKPDLTLYLDVEPATGLARARGRGELDRIEQAGLAFFERTRARYLSLAENDNSIVVVNAMNDMPEVHRDVQRILQEYLG